MKSNNNIQSKHTKTIYYVYLLINKINGKMYVGYSVNPEKRFKKGHCKNKKWPINKAIEKYGEHNFEVLILFDTFSIQEAGELERYYIKELNTLAKNGKGYNVHEGGLGGNTLAGMSEEKKKERSKKISKCQNERYNNMSEEQRSEFGREISDRMKGTSLYRYNDGTVKQLPIDHHDVLNGLVIGNSKGKKHSEETKRKRSNSMKEKNAGKNIPRKLKER